MNCHNVFSSNYDQTGRNSKKPLVLHFKVLFLDSRGCVEENNEKAYITTGLLVTKRGPPVCQVRGRMFLNNHFVTKLYNLVT